MEVKDTVDPYLPFGPAEDVPQGQPATRLSAVFSPSHTTTWKYERGTYTNLDSFARSGDRFRPDTVLVLRVKVGDAGYRDPAGNPVPETKFVGTGKAMLFHGGRVVRGTWSKKLDSTISLSTRAGELTVPAGHTWIELVPANGGNVTDRSVVSPVGARRHPCQGPSASSSAPRPAVGVGRAPAAARRTRPSRAGRRGCRRSRPRPRRRPGAGRRRSRPPAPTADMAPKKTRLNVSTMLGSRS